MPQFVAMNPHVEVNGQTVLSVTRGMGMVRSAAYQILEENQIHNPKPGHWYSQQNLLNAFQYIAHNVGASTLFRIGRSIPDNADFPPEIKSVHDAIASIDIAYHMNHRLNGEVMFNPGTGKMMEGIGHYGYERVDDKIARVNCDNPYPCDFDIGIIESMANRFRPMRSVVSVTHDTNECRKKGSSICRYIVTW